MRHAGRSGGRITLGGAVALCLVLLGCAAACGGTTAASAPSASPSTAPVASPSTAPVDVLYAGSLAGVMEKGIGPSFRRQTGDTFQGFAAGSTELASEIRDGTQEADVFISASPSVDVSLERPARRWVTWFATFATSPLVLGYDPRSPFAPQLKSKPWYEVVTEPSFALGRTDPSTDPKGVLADQVLTATASAHHEASLSGLVDSDDGVYPEETLIGRLQSGQLDAGFLYASEADAAGIPIVPLDTDPPGAQYTVTVLLHAPHPAADAFVAYVLGPSGRMILSRGGLREATRALVQGSRHVPEVLAHLFQPA